jgi:hypothetical protein
MPTLTDHHRRHTIELLEQGQDLPPDNRYLLFAPERSPHGSMPAEGARLTIATCRLS